MIVPMYKYSFVVYHREYSQFLRNIAELGVVDVSVSKNDVDDNIRSAMLVNSQIGDVIRILSNRKTTPAEAATDKEGLEVVADVKDILANIDKQQHKLNLLRKELALAEPWGDYSTETIKSLYDEGYTIRFFITPERRFTTDISEHPSVIEINRLQNVVYFIALQKKDEVLSFDADEIKVPAVSPQKLRLDYAGTEKELLNLNAQLDHYAALYIPALDESRRILLNDVKDQQVMIKTVKEADEKICILKGYVPQTDDEALEKYLKDAGIIYYKEQPVPDDNPPVLLRNGWFARLFEPIGEIFSLPNYSERDLTPFFAPFFMMFFGFCMGDAAYGIILILAGIFLRRFVSKDLKPYLTLAIFLGIGTVIFGIITGTMAGFKMKQYEIFQPIHRFMLDDQSIFYLALAIGLVQIIYGMIINAWSRFRQFGFKYALAQIGVIIAVFGALDMFLIKQTGEIATWVIYAGIFLMFFFSDPDINIFSRLGKGVWDLYSNVTGIFGDVLSYIRLFALSASSGILGYVINSVSLPLLHSIPVLGPILFIIVMIVGHGANIALSGLGSFVHPMRLTFVEFYKNAGFAGGGKKYTPYIKQ